MLSEFSGWLLLFLLFEGPRLLWILPLLIPSLLFLGWACRRGRSWWQKPVPHQ